MRLGVMVLVLSVLSGCTVFGLEFPAPGVFTDVNDAVKELDVESAGSVVYEGRYGVGGNYRPTYIAVLDGSDALGVIQDRLEDAGFDSIGFDETTQRDAWERGLGTDDYCFVALGIMEAGDGVYIGQSGSFYVESPSIFVAVTS